MFLMEKIRKFISNLENKPITLAQWLITFFAIIFLRNFFESISSTKAPIDSFSYFFHFTFSYIAIALFIIIMLVIFSKEKVRSIANLFIYFWPILIMPPVFDLIVSGGKGYGMLYIQEKAAYFFVNFFNFSVVLNGITYGQRLEILLVVIGIFFYVYFKRNNLFLGLISSFVTFGGIFVYGILPIVIEKLHLVKAAFPIAVPPGSASLVGPILQNPGQVIFSVYNALIVIFLLILFFIYNRTKLKALILAIFKKSFYYLIFFGIGLYVAFRSNNPDFLANIDVLTQYFNAIVAIILTWVSATALNDLYDYKADFISDKKKLLVRGIFSKKSFLIISVLAFCMSLANAYSVSYNFAIYILSYHAISFIYSVPPLRLKRVPFLSTFLVTIATLLIMWAGYSFSGFNAISEFPWGLTFTVLILFTFGLSFKDLKDLEGDKEDGSYTIPMLFGKYAFLGTSIVVGACYLLVPFLLNSINFLIPSILGGVLSFYFINKKSFKENYTYYTFFIYLISLVMIDYYFSG